MKVMYLGGNGNISWWCVKKSLEMGHQVYVLSRGMTLKTRREIPPNCQHVQLDINDEAGIIGFLKLNPIDIVCDFICFNGKDAKKRILLFKEVKQYIFISSVVVYERKTCYLPFKETTPKWALTDYDYASGKISAEIEFMEAFSKGFPLTIVRPAHTYDTIVPAPIGHNCFTAPKRYLEGKAMLIPGDGTNLWALCHSSDFADAFYGLIDNMNSVGEDYHIAGEEWLTWLDIADHLLAALNIKDLEYLNVSTSQILKMELKSSKNLSISYLGPNFKGQRMWCDIYDNSKIKKVVPGWACKVPFSQGIKLSIDWLMQYPERMRFNEELDLVLDEITKKARTK